MGFVRIALKSQRRRTGSDETVWINPDVQTCYSGGNVEVYGDTTGMALISKLELKSERQYIDGDITTEEITIKSLVACLFLFFGNTHCELTWIKVKWCRYFSEQFLQRGLRHCAAPE